MGLVNHFFRGFQEKTIIRWAILSPISARSVLIFISNQQEVSKMVFGPHLMLDCYGCKKEKLLDAAFVLKFLDELPGMIGMHKIAPPYLLNYPGTPGSWDRGGISAIVLIAESHISIHTFPHPNGYMNIDIFSCKSFDVGAAIRAITETFGAARYDKRLFMRGREFPKDSMKAMAEVGKQRKGIKLAQPNQLHVVSENILQVDGRHPTR